MPENEKASEIKSIKIDTGKNILEIKWVEPLIAEVHCNAGVPCFDKAIRVAVNGQPSEVPKVPLIRKIGLARDETGKLSLHLHLNNSVSDGE
jgi:hypothetical protein